MNNSKKMFLVNMQKDTNVYVPNNYYYAGEFGYFNVVLLELLEKYDGNQIVIHTFPDYCYIINQLFGSKFKFE